MPTSNENSAILIPSDCAGRGDASARRGIFPLSRRVAAETIGTGLLTAAVVGSGIMAELLAGGNTALELLANSIATGAALIALILAIGPISGAHLNPVVTLAEAFSARFRWIDFPGYAFAQIVGACGGAILANLMFGLPAVLLSHRERSGGTQFLSEFVATFGLVFVIQGCSRLRAEFVALAVAAYITAAYWFTASTSFANPAVTIARSLSDTFAGIRPMNVPPFLLALLAGGLSATRFFRWLFSNPQR